MARRHFDKDRDQRREQDALVGKARRGERDTLAIPNDPSLRRPPLATDSLSMRARRLMLEAEDRRQFHPERELAPAKLLDGRPSRGLRVAPGFKKKLRTDLLIDRRMRERQFLPWKVAFTEPREVLVCLRRRMRREVLHALRMTGKGSGRRQKRIPKHQTPFSGVQC